MYKCGKLKSYDYFKLSDVWVFTWCKHYLLQSIVSFDGA